MNQPRHDGGRRGEHLVPEVSTAVVPWRRPFQFEYPTEVRFTGNQHTPRDVGPRALARRPSERAW